jgi:hypothetical protein
MRRNLQVELLLIEAVATASTVAPGDYRKSTRNRVDVLGFVDGVIGK